MDSHDIDNSSDIKKLMKALKVALIAVAIIALIISIGFIVMLLWNNTIAVIFSVTTISYWQAVGLFILAKLFFGMGGGNHHSNKGAKKKRIKQRVKDRVNERLEDVRFTKDDQFKEFWQSQGKQAYETYLAEKDG